MPDKRFILVTGEMMDPTPILEFMRASAELAVVFSEAGCSRAFLLAVYSSIVDAFEALDLWLSEGNELPEQWAKAGTNAD